MLAPPENRQGYVFLTGATGLVGRYLLRDLLLAGQRVAVLVRSSKRWSAVDRIESIMQAWEQELSDWLPRPVILEGDLGQPQLGLSADQTRWISRHCDRAVHGAAVLQFQGARDQEPWLTNYDGTCRVSQLCQECDIQQFHYLSTAYVCGNRSHQVLESELEAGQSFRNAYEESKFAAEQLIRAHWQQRASVYRPAVIVGDSKTGATSSYHGLYLYLRLMAFLVPQQQRAPDGTLMTPIRLPFSGDEPRNLVPVDWVSEAICRLILDPLALGKTFHLAPETGTTARTVIESCYEYFKSAGVEYGDSEVQRDSSSEFARQFFENTKIYQMYETSDPTFDRANLLAHLPTLKCPVIDKSMIHRFLEFGQRDRWGRAAQPKPQQVDDGWLQQRMQEWHRASGHQRTQFDIVGPGGGQWSVQNESPGNPICSLGLDSNSSKAVRLTADQLCSIPQPANTAAWGFPGANKSNGFSQSPNRSQTL